nr:ankyrin repeat-containing protein C6C3.08-like [Biomphalaria glabrata]
MAKDPAELLRMKDLQGLTPLRKAVALNKAEIARILVAYGAEPSVRDPAGRTVLHIAVMQGRRELIAPLLVSKDSCVNVQDSHGWSPLHFAVRGKHIHAINWLLYAGADISLKNKEDKTAMDLCDEDSPIRAMLAKYERALDDGPLDLCSSFIGRKQLNQIGPDGLLMFVTSSIWSERMQFIFCIRIRPYRAMPPIPLRLDEQYYSDVWHYRMMRRLSPKETRVKAYFRLFEELIDTEIVLKITSKRKFLGEIPFTLSKYTQFNYTSFLAGAEMDLKDEGQFVMVKRPISYMLLKDQDGIYSNRHCGMFKFNLPDGVLPNPPPEWNNTRYDREWEEAEAMMKKLLPETESETNEATVTEKQVVWGDRNMNADAAPDVEATPEGGKGAEDGKDGAGGEEKEPGENEEEEEEEEDWPGGIRPGTILEGDEPDECADFYFISKGWALYLQVAQLGLSTIYMFHPRLSTCVNQLNTLHAPYRLAMSFNTLHGPYRLAMSFNTLPGPYRLAMSFNTLHAPYRLAMSFNTLHAPYRLAMSFNTLHAPYRLAMSFNTLHGPYRLAMSFNTLHVSHTG